MGYTNIGFYCCYGNTREMREIMDTMYVPPEDVVCEVCKTKGKWRGIGGFAEALAIKCLKCGHEQVTWW